MDEELLISLVKDRGELYDPEHKQYQDNQRRLAAWREIAKKIKMQPHECRDRWKQLRENYRKAMNLRQIQKAKGIKKLKAVKHGQIMAFIDNKKKRESERDDSQNTGFSTTTTKFDRCVERQEDPVDPLTVPERNLTTTKSDTVGIFFKNLGETVKTFPEEVQIRVKRDIFKIINEAEEEVLMNKTKVGRVRNMHYGLIDF